MPQDMASRLYIPKNTLQKTSHKSNKSYLLRVRSSAGALCECFIALDLQRSPV